MMWQGLAGWGRRGGVWALMAAAAFWLSGCASTVTTRMSITTKAVKYCHIFYF